MLSFKYKVLISTITQTIGKKIQNKDKVSRDAPTSLIMGHLLGLLLILGIKHTHILKPHIHSGYKTTMLYKQSLI